VLEAVFWISVGLIVYTHVGYPLTLWVVVKLWRRPTLDHPRPLQELPLVSLIVAAYDEAEVIAAKVENALALDYPRERLQLIVASDGSSDATVEAARGAGADLVLDLPRGGKIAAQDAAAERASGEVLAFSDANSFWRSDALLRLVEPFADPAVGYVCGQLQLTDGGGDNQEGLYWRYEMAVRELESGLGVSAGSRPATVGYTRCAATPTCRCRRAPATTSRFPSSWRSAGCGRCTRRGRLPRSGWSPPWRVSSPASGG